MPPQEKYEVRTPKDAEAQGDGTVYTISSKDSTAAANVEDDMDFDEILPYIGEFGWYQRTLFLMMIPFTFFVAWVYFSQIFITLVPPDYWCYAPELENLTVDER